MAVFSDTVNGISYSLVLEQSVAASGAWLYPSSDRSDQIPHAHLTNGDLKTGWDLYLQTGEGRIDLTGGEGSALSGAVFAKFTGADGTEVGVNAVFSCSVTVNGG
jgi:hypothetical protein